MSSAYIKDVNVKYELAEDLKVVQGNVEVELEGDFDEARLSISFNGSNVFSGAAPRSSAGSAKVPFSLGLCILELEMLNVLLNESNRQPASLVSRWIW